jgi:hypothetical protein
VAVGIGVILSPVLAVSYDGPPILEADPSILEPGSEVSIHGLGFPPREQGVLTLDGDSTAMPTYRARGNGSFVERFVVPSDAAVGPHAVAALGPDLIASVTVTVVGPQTLEPTPEPTAEITPEPTPEITPAPTPEITPAPTPEITPQPTPEITPAPATSVDHVFVVVMENHPYDEVWNTGSTPYTTSFADANARAANYFAITHPSLPNYLHLFGGSNYGITTNCSPSNSCHIDAWNLADNLEAAGLIWKGYFEDMPAPCFITDSGLYVARHNPFIYFDDIRTDVVRCDLHVVNYEALSIDLATATTSPSYSMIVPNNCNNSHDCSVATGDTWLSNNIPPILTSPACVTQRCLVVLTWDEDDGSQGNHVLTVFAGSAALRSSVSATQYDHFSLLRTIEDLLGVGTQTSNDGSATPMLDMLR